MHFESPSFAESIDAFMRLAFHIHALALAAQQPSDVRGNRIPVRANFRPLADHRAIDVANLKTCSVHPLNGFAQENRRVGAIMFRIVVREELPDVWKSERTEQRIRDSMQKRITIGMSNRSARSFDADSAEHKRPPRSLRRNLVEAVQVIPVTNPHRSVSPLGA